MCLMGDHRWLWDCGRWFVVSLTCFVGIQIKAADWPQWRGPERRAVSLERGLMQEWGAEGPPLAWKVRGLGGGDSAPAIAGGKVFGLSHRDGQEVVWALAESDGHELWVTALGEAVHQAMPQAQEGPSCTPSVDGDRLYVIGMSGRVGCLNVADGKVLWQRHLVQDFGGVMPTWSYRESPLVDDDKVICTPGGAEVLMVALNKMSGDVIWTSRLPQSSGDVNEQANRRGVGNETRGNLPMRSNEGQLPPIAGTKDPGLYESERWGMTAFAYKVPPGQYTVKLHFAETFAGITGAGQRIFTFNVEGKEFKDFDIWEKAGGFRRAYVESIPVEVTDGELNITFRRQVENPAIKAVEIIPSGEGQAIRIKAGQTTPYKDAQGQEWLADQGFADGRMNPGSLRFAESFPGGRGGARGRFGGFGGARSGAAYSSVIAIDLEGERQYVQLTADALVGVSAKDGKFLWRYDRPANRMGINCTTPIFHEGVIFATSAYGNGGGAIRLVRTESGELSPQELWFSTNMQNHHGGVIVVDGCLYGANGGNEGGFLTCMDFQTGKVLWRDREAPKGSLLYADGRLYLRTESGTMMLIEPSREQLVVRGRFEQPERSNLPAWAHPVIAHGKLYIRDQDTLLVYDVRAR
ncbi:MAG: serine/threonine protein kinase [Planctomycetaceae bacterium]|nr:MAG: serine/threonine protein kinase [Planctomycetaceae bacterium]